MITFNKPTSLNGEQLRQELIAAGVAISTDSSAVAIGENDTLSLDIKKADEAKALPIVTAHNGIDTPKEMTVAEKLAFVNLSLDELKAALV
jgi:hypothetical protein